MAEIDTSVELSTFTELCPVCGRLFVSDNRENLRWQVDVHIRTKHIQRIAEKS